MTAIPYDVFLAGAADGWYRRNRGALECSESMDWPFCLVEQLGDREGIHPVGKFSRFGTLEGFCIYREPAHATSDPEHGRRQLAYAAGDRRAVCGVLRKSLPDYHPVFQA